MESREFERLIKVVDRLLCGNGCRWDKAQSLRSLRGFVLEESLELVDALGRRDIEAIIEELGDILYHIVFIARLTRRRDSLIKAIKGVREKLINRHPHIFHKKESKSHREVVRDWERIKMKEKGACSIGYGLIRSFPALLSAYKLGVRSESYNFDWKNIQQVVGKLNEEIGELKEVLSRKRRDKRTIEYEIGDILFVIANIARHLDINPEIALKRTNRKFIRRFDRMYSLIQEEGKDIQSLSIEQIESYWQRAKRLVRD